jgi:hypothetical protein
MTMLHADEHRDAVDRAERALLDPSMEHIVEMVLRRTGEDSYQATAADGQVQFSRRASGHGWAFDVDAVTGRQPLADQAVDRFSPLADEQAAAYPGRSENAYPFAYEQVVQLFDAEAAPDVVSIHTAAHNWAGTSASTARSTWSRPGHPSSSPGPARRRAGCCPRRAGSSTSPPRSCG